MQQVDLNYIKCLGEQFKKASNARVKAENKMSHLMREIRKSYEKCDHFYPNSESAMQNGWCSKWCEICGYSSDEILL